MENTLTPQMITDIYASTSLGVAIMLAAAGLGSALGWGLICMKYIEGIARQPEMLPALRIQMFITAGLMESFPFIVLAFASVMVEASFKEASEQMINHILTVNGISKLNTSNLKNVFQYAQTVLPSWLTGFRAKVKNFQIQPLGLTYVIYAFFVQN